MLNDRKIFEFFQLYGKTIFNNKCIINNNHLLDIQHFSI